MLNPFAWIRRQAAEAVVLGTADGLRAVAPEGEAPPADLADLRALLASAAQPKALPAAKEKADDEEAEPSGRKARNR